MAKDADLAGLLVKNTNSNSTLNPNIITALALPLAGMLETAYALIRLGARTDITNASGSTALQCASNDDVNRAVSRYNNYWRR